MGWKYRESDLGGRCGIYRRFIKPDSSLVDYWHPATDHNDAAMLLERIAGMGLQKEFVLTLWALLETTSVRYADEWLMIHASPLKKTVAAIAAMGDE